MLADVGTAVSEHIKASVVKRVMEAYAACAIQLAGMVEKKQSRTPISTDDKQQDEGQHALLGRASQTLLERGHAAHAAAAKDVLASKWLPP